MPERFEDLEEYGDALASVLAETERLVNAGNAIESEPTDLIDGLRTYYLASESVGATTEPTRDPFASREDDRLFWAAVGDMAAFRCIAIVDCWAAATESAADPGDADLSELRRVLLTELDELRAELSDVIPLPDVAGAAVELPAIDILRSTVDSSIQKIADASTENVVSSAIGAIAGLLPAKVPGGLMRGLHRVGRALHLDGLLNWAQRLCNLALDKLRKLFGPRVDELVKEAKEYIDKVLHGREALAERMFALDELRRECTTAIDEIAGKEDATTIAEQRERAVNAVRERFRDWDRGLGIADRSMKWGGRLAVVHPPVAMALEGLRLMLSGGAFLVGQYYLDSPELRVPWHTQGVYTKASGARRFTL